MSSGVRRVVCLLIALDEAACPDLNRRRPVAMSMTMYEKGQRAMLLKVLVGLLEEKFGPLSAAVREKLEQTPDDRLMLLAKAVLRAQSLQELGLEP
jgi:hypothetical protein